MQNLMTLMNHNNDFRVPKFLQINACGDIREKMFCSCGTGSPAARRDSRNSVPGSDSDAGKQ